MAAMKRKAFKAQRKRVRRLFKYWIRSLGLLTWRIDVAYYNDVAEFQKDDRHITVMVATTDWQYCRSVIAVCVPLLVDFDDGYLEWAVIHELCHILVNEMQEPDADRKHQERVTTMLAKSFIWVRNVAQSDGDRAFTEALERSLKDNAAVWSELAKGDGDAT